jgi:hypothetical protein
VQPEAENEVVTVAEGVLEAHSEVVTVAQEEGV